MFIGFLDESSSMTPRKMGEFHVAYMNFGMMEIYEVAVYISSG